MTKNGFIRKLKFALIGGYKSNEREDVVNDYEGFFTEGRSDGLSEEDIITELGDPSDIALDMAREAHKPAPLGAVILKHLNQVCFIMSLAVFLGAGLLFRDINVDSSGMTLVADRIIRLVIMITAVYFALKPRMITLRENRNRSLTVTNVVLFIFAVSSCVFYNSKLSISLAFWVMKNNNSAWITNGLVEIRFVVLLATLVIGAWAVYGVWRGKTENFVTVIHALGLYMYLDAVAMIWRVLTEINAYWSNIATATLVYAATVVIIILYMLAVGRHGKGAVTNEL